MSPNRRITIGDRGFHERPPKFLESQQKTTLCFGKYAGKDIKTVPDSYLWWLHSETDDPALATVLDKEMSRRKTSPK
ncbi:hypothetical protein GCM10007100_19260 [Roseibacillus persicicus]|uniref:Uncharacterized protein n=2 Tax=Roseibacillus persicicus TaxID=454148 RepID=A0A918TNQ5_9BACT|nr:hypothetical protein GCM10007100_19260 [Roseibacillus persicicus]